MWGLFSSACRGLAISSVIALTLPVSAQTWQTMPSRADDEPGFVFTASPDDWRNIPIYHVITDRFFDGDPLNNDDNPEGDTNPFGTVSIHGGDFEGLEAKLDYIQMLGKRAIWISPVQLNVNGSFHGYAARDFNQIDPHWGTLQDLRNFIDAAHARGIYVIIDVVQNHLGDLADSRDFGYPNFNINGYNLRWRNSSRRHAPPFDNLNYLHNYGNVQNWDDPVQSILGDFMGLDAIRTEDPEVRQHLITIFSALISATDCDGFRVDTARHVEMDFWETFLPAIYDHAAVLGKTNFLVYAEAWRGTDEEVAPFTATNRFNSTLYFPMRDTMESVFVAGAPTSELDGRLANLNQYAPNARNQLVNFIDNHDLPRVLSGEKLNDNQSALVPALTFLYTASQIPCLYYGTEQGFNGANDPYDRENMFDGEFEFGPSLGDNFNMTHPLFRHVRRLNLLREAYPALKLGDYQERWVNGSGRGIFAYTKTLGTQQLFVVFNTADVAQTPVWNNIGPQTGQTNGTVMIDVLGNLPAVTVGAGGVGAGHVLINVPAYTSAIFVPQSELSTLPPSVTAITPAHDQYDVSRDALIQVDFDQPMDTNLVAQAFSLQPPASGTISWTNGNRTLIFRPLFSLAADQFYAVRIDATALSAVGLSPGATFESQFFTGQSGGGLSPLGNYVLDGVLDDGVPQVVGTNMVLFADFDASVGALYLATYDAGEGNDHFIFIDDNLTNSLPEEMPNWNKIGTIASDGPFLADENDNDFTGWYRVNAPANAKTGLNGGVLEGVINVYEQFGTGIERVYIAVVPYQNSDGGSLVAEFTTPPSANFDQNIDAAEFLLYDLTTGQIIDDGNTGGEPPGEINLKQYVITGAMNDQKLATLKQQGPLPLFADFNGELLYVATVDAGEGNDHFIFVTDDLSTTSSAPWAKSGQVAGLKHFLADENDGDFTGWFIDDSMDLNHPAATPYNNGGHLEGTLNVTNIFGGIPERLYIAVVNYATTDGGALQSAYQNPPAVITNNNLEADEYFVLEFSQFDTDGDGLSDLEEDLNRNGIMDPGETGARVPDSDGDGIHDGDEIVGGGDPLDPRVGMRVKPGSSNAGTASGVTFEWYGVTSHLYRILYLPELGLTNTWTPWLTNDIPGIGALQSIELEADQGGYFRLESRPASTP